MPGKIRQQQARRQGTGSTYQGNNAVVSDNWDWEWVALAAEAGIGAAAGKPLPDNEELVARMFARTLAKSPPETRAFLNTHADSCAAFAVTTYRAALPLMRLVGRADDLPERLPGARLAEATTNFAGRMAARAQRVVALLASEREGAQ